MWVNNPYDEILQEAVRCDQQLKSSQQQHEEDYKIRIFTRLVMEGKLCEST